MNSDRMPILVGCGQLTQRTAQNGKLEESLDPLQLLTLASERALADTGAAEKLKTLIDNISVVRFTADSSEAGRLPIGQYSNAPRSLGNRIGAKAKREYYTAVGGNTPQWLVNRTAEEIANGETTVALLAGSEDLATLVGALNKGVPIKWGEDAGGEPIIIGDNRRSSSTPIRSSKTQYAVRKSEPSVTINLPSESFFHRSQKSPRTIRCRGFPSSIPQKKLRPRPIPIVT
jgi:acetyl-CoA C-acetyltransferase